MTVGTVLGIILVFIMQVFLAKVLNVRAYGDFSTALSMVTIFSPVAAFGLSGLWLNIFGKEGSAGVRWLSASFKYFWISAFSVWFALLAWAYLGPHEDDLRNMILILSFYVFSHGATELLVSKYQLEGRYNKIAFWQILPHLMRLLFVFIIYLYVSKISNNHAGGIAYAIAYVASSVFLFFVCFNVFSKVKENGFNLSWISLNVEKEDYYYKKQPVVLDVFKSAWPYGVGIFLHLIYFQSGIILVRYVSGAESAAIYSVAFFVMLGIFTIPSAVYQKIMQARNHYWASHEYEMLIKSYKYSSAIMLAAGIVSYFLIVFISSSFILAFFGEEYRGSIDVLYILACCTPFRFLSISLGSFLLTGEHAKIKAASMMGVALINILLCVVFVRIYGVLGAAYAVLLSEILLFLIYYMIAKKRVFIGKIQ